MAIGCICSTSPDYRLERYMYSVDGISIVHVLMRDEKEGRKEGRKKQARSTCTCTCEIWAQPAELPR